MKRRAVLLAIAVVMGGCSGKGNDAPPMSIVTDPGVLETPVGETPRRIPERMNALAEDYYEGFLKLNPLWATFIGDNRYNNRLTIDISPEYRRDTIELNSHFLKRLEAIDPEELEEQDWITYQVLRETLSRQLEGFRYPYHLLPVDQFNGMHIFFAELGSGDGLHPFSTARDYRDFLGRIDGYVSWVDMAIKNMDEGIERGIVQPLVVMEKVLPQLAVHLVDSPTDSIFYQPIRNMPEEVAGQHGRELSDLYIRAIEEKIIPSYKRLHDYLQGVYLPRCRTTVGLSELPQGTAWYDYLLRSETTSNLSADEIHRIGLSEVRRIHSRMEVAAERAGFEGSLEELFEYLMADGRFYYSDSQELLNAYRSMKGRVDSAVAGLFSLRPVTPLEIRPIESFKQESAAAAEYMPGSPDGTRPGVFYVNTYDLESRPSYAIESLYLHEAVPGHHFQISLANELDALPRIRKFGDFSAYIEGWALYAESLGPELGMYRDPYSYFGSLAGEMLRAVRLVIDTGIHVDGWSREQALDYMKKNIPTSDTDAVAEIERYIVMPGQALSYKIGQMKIHELKNLAQESLGSDFDIRDFHAEVLKDGPMPLKVLDIKIRRWIEKRKVLSDT